MPHPLLPFVVVLAAMASASASAADSALLAAGQKKSVICTACHGAKGAKPLPNTPKLAGQKAEVIARALHEFKTGKRASAMMSPMARPLSEQDIQALAAYFSSVQ